MVVAIALVAVSRPPDALGFVAVEVPGTPAITALWRTAGGVGRHPAIIALHGCSGLRDSRGQIDERYTEYAARWNARGWHVLAPDSFARRGERSICRQPNSQRTITPLVRRGDVLRAFAWLAERDDVDPRHMAVVGWSHGAMTLLETLDASLWTAGAPVAMVAYYPGCRRLLDQPPPRPVTPLLMMLGARDDWSPPGRCLALMDRLRAAHPTATLTVEVFPDSYHGFDSLRPLRFWGGIPNGVDPAGVHVGGNPEARAKSFELLEKFLRAYLG